MHLSDVKPMPSASGGSTPLSPSDSGQSIASWIQQGTQAVSSVLQLVNQQKLASENLKRSRQGLAPLTYQDVPGLVPTAQVQAGLDTGTQQTVLLLGGAAILAYMLMKRPKGGRSHSYA